MESVFTLTDRAAEACGSRYKLAQALGASQSFLSRIASGKQPLPPSLAARMAVLAGTDARRAALAALVAQEKDPVHRETLAQLFDVPNEFRNQEEPGGVRTIL